MMNECDYNRASSTGGSTTSSTGSSDTSTGHISGAWSLAPSTIIGLGASLMSFISLMM
jgi:hypothetical protein